MGFGISCAVISSGCADLDETWKCVDVFIHRAK